MRWREIRLSFVNEVAVVDREAGFYRRVCEEKEMYDVSPSLYWVSWQIRKIDDVFR